MRREDGAEPVRMIPRLGYKPLIGVVHLPPIGRSYRFGASVEDLVDYAVAEAGKLESAGFDAVIVENYGDAPFEVVWDDDSLTVAVMAVVAREVSRAVSLRVGVNILRNDYRSLVSAYAASADFVRVNSVCEHRYAPEGLLKPAAPGIARLQRLPRRLLVLADIGVKHSWGLPAASLDDVAVECSERGGVDALVVTGERTGMPPSPGMVAAVRSSTRLPVLIGSGLTAENLAAYYEVADGFIVGSYLKMSGTASPINPEKARRLASKLRELRGRSGGV